jgi:spore coat protein U-like protein
MKTLLRGTVAAIAFVSMTGVAQAQTHQTTNQRHYAVDLAVFGGGVLSDSNPDAATAALYDSLLPVGNALGFGTRYTASTTAPDNTELATPVVTNAFTLTGNVTKDCSFYAGNNASARTIDFGVIGVRTGNNENVGSAFEMAGDLNATINTLTAGCNFNNEVKIAKGNQWGDGMNLVGNPGGFDTTQFQTNIPYTVTAKWNGVAENAIEQGGEQELEVGLAEASDTKTQGAWRSAMNIAINAPAISNRGLVAGTYTDTMTVTLSAL